MEELGRLDALAEQLAQSYPGATAGGHRPRRARGRSWVSRPASTPAALAELERELREPGALRAGARRLAAAVPEGAAAAGGVRAARRRGPAEQPRRGERETRRAGAAGEPTGATRPWAFGDTEAWNVPRTLTQRRSCAARPATPRRLDVTDVEIVETEQRSRAAVALCVDTSWSMVQDGRWVPMKRTALALHQLVSTRFRGDALKLITFGRHARDVALGELIGLEGAYEQGTNLHHALLLAGQHLQAAPGRPARRAGGDRRRADRAPRGRRLRRLRLPAVPADPGGDGRRGGPADRPARVVHVLPCSATTRGWRGSSTRWRGGAAAGSWRRRWTGWAPRWWRTTCGPA